MAWLIILVLVLAALGVSLCYLTACVGRFGGVRRLSGGRTWLRRLLSLAVLALCFALLTLWLSLVNAIVIFLHAVLFFLLFGLLFRLVKRRTGREPRVNWQGWLALACTCLLYTSPSPRDKRQSRMPSSA